MIHTTLDQWKAVLHNRAKRLWQNRQSSPRERNIYHQFLFPTVIPPPLYRRPRWAENPLVYLTQFKLRSFDPSLLFRHRIFYTENRGTLRVFNDSTKIIQMLDNNYFTLKRIFLRFTIYMYCWWVNVWKIPCILPFTAVLCILTLCSLEFTRKDAFSSVFCNGKFVQVIHFPAFTAARLIAVLPNKGKWSNYLNHQNHPISSISSNGPNGSNDWIAPNDPMGSVF